MAETDIKLSIFNGNWLEDPEQHWFLCKFVWTMGQFQGEAIKKVQLIKTFRGCELYWYMKFSIVPVGVAQKKIDQIRVGMIDKFRKMKYELQCIIEIKEINQLSRYSLWDIDQRFKTLMAKVSFHMSDVHHKECFIVALFLHIRIPLMQ